MSLRIGHVIQGLSPESGGPSQVVLQLAEAQARLGATVATFCEHRDADWQPTQRLIDQLAPSGKVAIHARPAGPRVFGHSLGRRAAQALTERLDELDVLHIHGIWSGPCLNASRIAHARGKPYVLRPAGMLEPWSLGHRAWKKRLAMRLAYRSLIDRAVVIHVTGEKEARGLKPLGIDQPVALLPNGVNPPQAAPPDPARQIAKHWPQLAGRRLVLFIGRLHKVKGLENLIPAWAQVAAEHPDAQLVLAGPDEAGYQQTVERLIDQHQLHGSVTLTGGVWGEQKAALLAAATLVVQPSLQENFGVVMAEALAFGKPVITTDQTPWRDLIDHDCGWWIELGVPPLVSALRQALGMPVDQLNAMGDRGRALIESKYTWPAIAAGTIELYRWATGQGERPGFVRSATAAAGC